jgi:hypothetical protein
MSENNIAKLSFPASSIDDVINQVARLRISLFMGPETEAERIEGILATPDRPRGLPSMSGVLPEWLKLYNAGMVGFHVSILPVEPTLEARLTAVFRERGIIVNR